MDKLTLSDIRTLKKLPENVQKDILWLVEDATTRFNQNLEKLKLKDTAPAPNVVLLAPRKTPPIFTPHLPPELMAMIFEHIDLYSLRSFSLVNSACLPMVKNVRRYKELLDNIPEFFSILHKMQSSNLLSDYDNFYTLLSDWKCHSCRNSFAPFIYTPAYNRCCLQCLRRGRSPHTHGFAWFPIPLTPKESLLLDRIGRNTSAHSFASNYEMLNRGYAPYIQEDPQTGESQVMWREAFESEPAPVWEDGSVGMMQKRMKHTIYAPVYDRKREFWVYGFSCIACSVDGKLDLLVNGLEGFMKHMANCDRAVTMFWEVKRETLDSIWQYCVHKDEDE